MPVMAMKFKEPVWLIWMAVSIFGLFVFKRVIGNVKLLKDRKTALNLILFDTIKRVNEKS